MNDRTSFAESFRALTGNEPFRWQERLFQEFIAGRLPSAIDLPTGLGKTSVMAIWLIARALADDAALKNLPRRLVYVVDRRAVVDQATAEAEKLRAALEGQADHFDALGEDARQQAEHTAAELKKLLGLTDRYKLPISTLRGQYIDNREWLANPTVPAIIVGTVDMIGSRLLFSGYGVRRKMRPYHAGLLGVDALAVLDEAHLVAPFQALVEQVSRQTMEDSQRMSTIFRVPPLRTMALSATGRATKGKTFQLEDKDIEKDEVIRKRVNAPKWIKLSATTTGNLAEVMAAQAIALADGRHRVLVFCNSRKVAGDVYVELEEHLKKTFGKEAAKPGASLGLIVGARRVREREQLADSVVFRRFARLPPKEEGSEQSSGSAFLVATSAGEVGVDIDADHMVCDLVAWERMVQRLGRVNRRGELVDGSLVDVFVAVPDKEVEAPAGTPSIDACRAPFDCESWTERSDGRLNGSPGVLQRLQKDDEYKKLAEAATTVEPLRPVLTRALLDAWSMTSLEVHTGRPGVAPWIRGWIDEEKEPPQCRVLWRRYLPIRENEALKQTKQALAAFFDAAPPHISEILETEAYRVVEVLRARAKTLLNRQEDDEDDGEAVKHPEVDADAHLHGSAIVAVVLAQDNSIEELLRLGDIQNRNAKRLQSSIANRQVVLDGRIGGLATSGLLDPKVDEVPETLDSGGQLWNDELLQQNGYGFRIRQAPHDDGKENWKIAYRRFVDAESEEADDIASRMEWRVEEWVGDGPADNDPALARFKQKLECHHNYIKAWADRIAEALQLPDDLHDMLVTIAFCHDSGKARVIWQRYAGNPGFARNPDENPPLAKFTARGDANLLKVGSGTYRHEFGSVRDAVEHKILDHLPRPIRALGLLMLARHHGSARPTIFAYDEGDPAVVASTKLADQLRIDGALLARQWGPWSLAWWETLLRAADVAASREKPREDC